MQERSRIYSAVLSAIFLLALATPLILFLAGPRKEVSTAEKRRLAVLPPLKASLKGLQAFPKQFDAFYKDHFGLRDQLVRMSSMISLRLLHVSPTPFVVQGKDGWFFYAQEGVIEDYFGQQQADVMAMDDMASTLVDRRDWLAAMGMRYLFVPVPNKIAIHDEHLPSRMRRSRGPTFHEQFLSFLDQGSRFKDFVDLRALFKHAKADRQLYLKTDTHWTNDGALLAFGQIAERCRQWFPENPVQTLTEAEIRHKTIPFSGDLTLLMHQEATVSEDAPIVEIKAPCAGPDKPYVSPAVAVFDSAPTAAPGLGDPPLMVNGCPRQQLTALVLHDSFGHFLHHYFSERFGKVVYAANRPFKELKELMRTERPDVVVEVCVARNLRKALAPDPQTTAELLEERFAASADTALRIDQMLDPTSVLLQNDLRLERDAEGLRLHATGSDPFLAVPFAPAKSGQRWAVEVVLDAPAAATMALYFTIAGKEKEFVPRQMVLNKLRKGKNRLLFRLPHPEVRGMLRLDLGDVPGTYLLRSLTVKAVQEGATAIAAKPTPLR